MQTIQLRYGYSCKACFPDNETNQGDPDKTKPVPRITRLAVGEVYSRVNFNYAHGKSSKKCNGEWAPELHKKIRISMASDPD
jgi:hypothetical protein